MWLSTSVLWKKKKRHSCEPLLQYHPSFPPRCSQPWALLILGTRAVSGDVSPNTSRGKGAENIPPPAGLAPRARRRHRDSTAKGCPPSLQWPWRARCREASVRAGLLRPTGAAFKLGLWSWALPALQLQLCDSRDRLPGLTRVFAWQFARGLPDNPDSLLTPAAISRHALLVLLGYGGMGPWLVKPLPCWPCYHAWLPVP